MRYKVKSGMQGLRHFTQKLHVPYSIYKSTYIGTPLRPMYVSKYIYIYICIYIYIYIIGYIGAWSLRV